MDYPPNVRIVNVPCTGRVDMLHLLKAIEDGADGVYVAGCHEGECHFQNGNLKAKRRVAAVKKILEEVGLEPERVEMFHVSASDGPGFAAAARQMTERIRGLGPSPVGPMPDCDFGGSDSEQVALGV